MLAPNDTIASTKLYLVFHEALTIQGMPPEIALFISRIFAIASLSVAIFILVLFFVQLNRYILNS